MKKILLILVFVGIFVGINYRYYSSSWFIPLGLQLTKMTLILFLISARKALWKKTNYKNWCILILGLILWFIIWSYFSLISIKTDFFYDLVNTISSAYLSNILSSALNNWINKMDKNDSD